MKRIVIVGAGGFGREVEHVIHAINAVAPTWEVMGFVDDTPSGENLQRVEALGHRVLGSVDEVLATEPEHFVLGIGSGHPRRILDARFTEAGWSAATLVHPHTSLGRDVELGPGTIVCAGVRATTNIRTGRHVHLNLNVTVGHDVTLHDYVTVNPLVAISGGVEVAAQTLIGTTSAILQNLSVGARSTVGAGALVTKDVADDVIVKGIPAR
ncbi:MAG: acetyltransferase [Actinobacteria bacterium]|nr:acetyltransferase [Actinomycetota bacterium]